MILRSTAGRLSDFLRMWIFIVFTGLITGGSCKKDSSPAPDLSPGSLSFTYSGYRSGSYSVTGDLPASTAGSNIYNFEWASAKRFSDLGKEWIGIYSNLLSTDAKGNMQMAVPNSGPGVFPLPSALLNDMIAFYNLPGSSTASDVHDFVTGAVNVTSVTSNRIKGTFSATIKMAGTPGNTLQITNGRFSVKITP